MKLQTYQMYSNDDTNRNAELESIVCLSLTDQRTFGTEALSSPFLSSFSVTVSISVRSSSSS